MISAPETKAPARATECRPAARDTGLASGFRWRVLEDHPLPKLTRYQRLYFFLFEYNRY